MYIAVNDNYEPQSVVVPRAKGIGHKFNKDYCLKGGGAIQDAWRAGYLGKHATRFTGVPDSIAAIVYRAGQAFSKNEKTIK